MGMGSALKLKRVVANTRYVLAIEAVCAAQALEYRLPLRPGPRARRALEIIRSVAAPLAGDRPLSSELERVAVLIGEGRLAEVLG